MSKNNKKKGLKNPNKDIREILPIEYIDSGVIKTIEGQYLRIMEVLPINFDMRSMDEKIAVLSSFRSVFFSLKSKVQFKIVSSKTDTTEHENSMIESEAEDFNHPQREFLKEYIEFVRELGRQTSVSRRFFVILQFQKDKDEKMNFTNIWNSLEQDVSTIAAAFESAGNEIKRYDNDPNELHRETLAALYYILNPRSSMVEGFFEQRIPRVISDTEKEKMNVDENSLVIDPINLIAPRGVKFYKDYTVIDGLYRTYLYVSNDGYPKQDVGIGWAGAFLGFGEGVTFDIFLEKKDSEDMENKLYTRENMLKGETIEMNDKQKNLSEVFRRLYSIKYMRSALSNNEEIFYMTIVFTIQAPTLRELRKKTKKVRNSLRSGQYSVYEAKYMQRDFFIATLPLCNSTAIEKITRRNVTTDTLAGSYPFTAFEMTDTDGVLTGLNAQNGSLFIQNLFNRKDYKNANMVILGSSGSGKSFLLQMLAGRYRLRQDTVYAILPLKGTEFRRGVEAHGGEFIRFNPGSQFCLNFLEIMPIDTTVMVGDDDEVMKNQNSADSFLIAKIQKIKTWFPLIYPEITKQEKIELETALFDTYASYGITETNRSLFDKNGNIKKMPHFEDLYYNLNNVKGRTQLAEHLRQFVYGTCSNLNADTNFDTENKYIVFDVSGTDEELLPAFMFIALDFIWMKVRQDKTKNKIIILDELWKLMNANDEVAKDVLEIFKIIRGYGGGAWAATQDISDFFMYKDGTYGRGILDASKTKILLGVEEDESHVVQEVVGLTNSERRLLATARMKGEGLVCCNNNKIHFVGKPTDYEYKLYTTSASDLAEQRAQKEKEKNYRDPTFEDVINQLPGAKTYL